MKIINLYFACLIAFVLASCTTTQQAIIPTNPQLPTTQDNYTITWLGNSKAFVYVNGKYQRAETYDYTFSVVQRRYGNVWKSVKDLHRIHPNYDGKAGKRDQTMYFGIDFRQTSAGIVSKIHSSLGKGKGKSDKEFREQSFELTYDNISSFAPYNTMRITQHYQYEQGLLLETVELFKRKGDKEIPFMKIEERAEIFRPVRLNKAPTVFK